MNDRITWKELVYKINALIALPNGGADITFDYKGEEYTIVQYNKGCQLQCGDKIVDYKTIEELGESSDFGFKPMEIWNTLEILPAYEPHFDEFTLDEILEAYRTAWGKTKR